MKRSIAKIKKFEDNYELINYYIILFLSMSVFGWCMEFLYSLIVRNKIVNPGFLFGPYCPIYGYGALLLLIILSKYKKNKGVLFLNSMLICSIFEYFTSYLLEIIFKKRIWNYTNSFLNINGRICLFSALIWGLLGVIFITKIEPYLYKKFVKLKESGITIFFYLLGFIYLFDTFFSIMKHLMELI